MYNVIYMTLYISMCPHLLYSAEIVSEVWHEVGPCVGSYKQPHPAEIGPSVAGNKRVANPSDHPGETNESLGELLIGQEAVTLQNGCLDVAVGERRCEAS